MNDERTATPGPSVKGTGFNSVLQDVRALRDAGRITRKQLKTRLEPSDLAYLDAKIGPTTWYPVESYVRFLELLCDVEGEGQRQAYLVRRGAIAADRLRDSGLYPMLDVDTGRLGLRALRLFITIAEALYNFTKWRGEVDEPNRRFTIYVEQARAYPDVARWVAEGFLARGAERVTGQPVEVTSERPDENRVVFEFKIGR